MEWVQHYLGEAAHKRLILTHHKNLNRGEYLIDDRTKNGAGEFSGEHIVFGSAAFPMDRQFNRPCEPKAASEQEASEGQRAGQGSTESGADMSDP